MSRAAPVRKLPPVKTNKYASVGGKLNTGATVNRVGFAPDRRGEIFERVSRSLLAEMLEQDEAAAESVYDLSAIAEAVDEDNDDGGDACNDEDDVYAASASSSSSSSKAMTSLSPVHARRSHQHRTYQSNQDVDNDDARSVVSQRQHQQHRSSYASAASVSSAQQSNEPSPSDADFLLIDVRAEDEYNACHIRGAGSFSFAHLRQDKMTAQLVRLRSNPNKARANVLILYDEREDDKVAIQAATNFLGKQFPNVAILTGGLLYFAEKFPHLIAGHLPASSFASSSSSSSSSSSKLTASALAGLGHAPSSFSKSSSASPSVSGASQLRSPTNKSTLSTSRITSSSPSRNHASHSQSAEESMTALQWLRQRTLTQAGLNNGYPDSEVGSFASHQTKQSSASHINKMMMSMSPASSRLSASSASSPSANRTPVRSQQVLRGY